MEEEEREGKKKKLISVSLHIFRIQSLQMYTIEVTETPSLKLILKMWEKFQQSLFLCLLYTTNLKENGF